MKNAGSSQARGRALNALALLSGAALLLAVSPAWAAGSGTAMPWEGPLDTIMQSLSGPVAKAIGIIAIVLTGLGFAFAEGGSALRKGDRYRLRPGDRVHRHDLRLDLLQHDRRGGVLMARSDVEGFEIAFHSSLSEPVTIAGVPRMIAVLNGTLTAVLALGLQVPLIGIPLGLAIHGACYWLNKRDPYFFDALGRHIRQKPYLDA